MERTAVVLQDNGFGETLLFSDDDVAGKMEISVEKDLLTVYHTEVGDAYSGKGYGKILLQAMVDYARTNKLKVRPLCPFVHTQFKRHEADYQDIWLKEEG
jgi:predicted GNAT family acetyltransferase